MPSILRQRVLLRHGLVLLLLTGVIALVAGTLAGADVGAQPGSQTATVQTATANGKVIRVVFNERKKKPLTVAVKRVNAGKITLRVENKGKTPHLLVVIRTTKKPRALPLKGNRARTKGRVGRILVRPGKTRLLTLNLKAGRYVLIGNRPGHYKEGEFRGLRVLKPAAAPPPQPGPPPPSSASRALFVQNCGICHVLSDAGTTGKIGPNLDQSSLSKAGIVDQTTNGGGGMPAFKGALTPQQIDDIASYIAQVRAG